MLATTPVAPPNAERLLDAFDPKQRGPLANVFYRQYRCGAPPYGYASDAPWTPEMLRLAVMREITERVRRAYRQDYREEYERYGDWAYRLGRDVPATLDFCAYVIWREQLPAEQRQRLKQERTTEHARAWLEEQPATASQMSYLKALGYSGPVASRAHASSLIDVLKRGGRVEVAS